MGERQLPRLKRLGTPALQVELFLVDGRVQGVTTEVTGRQRLLDVLNTTSATLSLEQVGVKLASSPGIREFADMSIEKRSILVAIPHETEDQKQQRAVLTTTVGRAETRTLPATFLLPPFVVEGSVHIPRGVGGFGNKITADAGVFAQFISVTNAKLILPGGSEVIAPVLLLNRDLIAGISTSREQAAFPHAVS